MITRTEVVEKRLLRYKEVKGNIRDKCRLHGTS